MQLHLSRVLISALLDAKFRLRPGLNSWIRAENAAVHRWSKPQGCGAQDGERYRHCAQVRVREGAEQQHNDQVNRDTDACSLKCGKDFLSSGNSRHREVLNGPVLQTCGMDTRQRLATISQRLSLGRGPMQFKSAVRSVDTQASA